MRRAAFLAALALCAAGAAIAEPQYTYFCAGDAVPPEIAEITKGPGKLTFFRSVIVEKTHDELAVYPAESIPKNERIAHYFFGLSVAIAAGVVLGTGLDGSTIDLKNTLFDMEQPPIADILHRNCGEKGAPVA